MKSLKQLFCAAALMVTALSANAALITQEVKINGVSVASMGVDLDETALASYSSDPFFDATVVDNLFYPDVFTLLNFNLFGEAVDLVDGFLIVQDTTNLNKGFDLLSFDVTSVAFGFEMIASFYYDVTSPMDAFFTVSYPGGVSDTIFGDEAEFSVVPEPSVLSVFALGMMLLLTARRQRK